MQLANAGIWEALRSMIRCVFNHLRSQNAPPAADVWRSEVWAYEKHVKAASPWFSRARGHSQFKVPPVTLNDSHSSPSPRRLASKLRVEAVDSCRFIFIFFFPSGDLEQPWFSSSETMPMKLESNVRGCWSCRQARFVRRSARLLCRCHPAAHPLLLCLHLALWYRPVGARPLSKHRELSSVIVFLCLHDWCSALCLSHVLQHLRKKITVCAVLHGTVSDSLILNREKLVILFYLIVFFLPYS